MTIGGVTSSFPLGRLGCVKVRMGLRLEWVCDQDGLY